MAAFAEFDQYLTDSSSDDYWSDEGILQARVIVHGFNDEDWESLNESWRERDESWQTRCAQVLSHGAPQHAVAIVLGMVGSQHEESRIAAFDSLREMDLSYLEAHDLDRIAMSIDQSLKSASPIECSVLNALKLQLLALRK